MLALHDDVAVVVRAEAVVETCIKEGGQFHASDARPKYEWKTGKKGPEGRLNREKGGPISTLWGVHSVVINA